jgi:hypothetical protein
LEELLAQILTEAELEEARQLLEDDGDSEGDAEELSAAPPGLAESDASGEEAGEVEEEPTGPGGAAAATDEADDIEQGRAHDMRRRLFGGEDPPAELAALETAVGVRGVWATAGRQLRHIRDAFPPRGPMGYCRLIEWGTAIQTQCLQGHGACSLQLRSRRRAGVSVGTAEAESVAWLAAGWQRSAAEHTAAGQRVTSRVNPP